MNLSSPNTSGSMIFYAIRMAPFVYCELWLRVPIVQLMSANARRNGKGQCYMLLAAALVDGWGPTLALACHHALWPAVR